MKKNTRDPDNATSRDNEEIDTLEREIQFMNNQIAQISQNVDAYAQRIKQLEDERTRLYAAGIYARAAEMSATSIGKVLPTVGVLSRKIGDIVSK
jgi:predicted  nucleic acid-binding Zn-ribbon protein